MSDTVIASIISIAGVLISVTVSVIITRAQSKVELEKIKKLLEQEYLKSLFDKRVETYPELYSLLARYGKTIQYNRHDPKSLIKLRDDLDNWNNQHSIFFSKNTAKLSSRFRKYLRSILKKGAKSEIAREDWALIENIMERFGMSLKSEIGVASMQPVGNLEGIEEINKLIEERIDELDRK